MTTKSSSLQFTGERLIPEFNQGAAFYYEHIARYYFAAQFAKAKRVLDAGCGVGYGTNILATVGQAREVFGIDISTETIAYAKKKYDAKNCIFVRNSILNIKNIKNNTIDLAVSFEVIEHITAHDQFLNEIIRVLTKDGIFLVSTPNKNTYREGNVFHKKELYPDEFESLLKKHFKHVKIFHQNFEFSEIIHSVHTESFGIEEKFVANQSNTLTKNPNNKTSQYMIAVCSNEPLPAIEPLIISTPKVDGYDLSKGIESIGAGYLAIQNQYETCLKEQKKLLSQQQKLSISNSKLSQELITVKQRNETLSNEIQSLNNLPQSASFTKILRLLIKVYTLKTKLWLLMHALLSLFKRSLVAIVYALFSVLFFLTSFLVDLFRAKNFLTLSKSQTKLNGISFLIPTWNKKDLVVICVKLLDKAISRLQGTTKAEIIVIDNGSVDGTSEALLALKLKNPLIVKSLSENIGFARGINLGAATSKYNYLYVLNNDMEVHSNFLTPIVTFAKKLLATNQPFFGIASQIFFFDPSKRREESGKTYSKFSLGFLKVAHFVEEAALTVPSLTLYPGGGSSLLNKTLFLAMGGYDHRSYTPLYCEDLDSGVSAWSYGYPSYFLPTSKVIHHHRSSSKQLAVDPSFYMFKNWLVLVLKQLNSPIQIAKHICLYTLRIFFSRWYAKYAFEAIKNGHNIWLSRYQKTSYLTKYSTKQLLNFVEFEIAQLHEKT